jgi:predicted nuclease of predicted toxin-antitoxin system
VKFKFDENLPAELGAVLRVAGHDAHSVPEENLRGAADTSIASVCREEQRILITLDLDFAHIKNYPPRTVPASSFCVWCVRTGTRF